jgi:hypothetical protein
MDEKKELDDHDNDRPFSDSSNHNYASSNSTFGHDNHIQQGTFGENEVDQVNIEGITL